MHNLNSKDHKLPKFYFIKNFRILGNKINKQAYAMKNKLTYTKIPGKMELQHHHMVVPYQYEIFKYQATKQVTYQYQLNKT